MAELKVWVVIWTFLLAVAVMWGTYHITGLVLAEPDADMLKEKVELVKWLWAATSVLLVGMVWAVGSIWRK